jgi:hypothetical protein
VKPKSTALYLCRAQENENPLSGFRSRKSFFSSAAAAHYLQAVGEEFLT